MSLLEKPDEEIFKIAEPILNNVVNSSNIKDYGGFTKYFSSQKNLSFRKYMDYCVQKIFADLDKCLSF